MGAKNHVGEIKTNYSDLEVCHRTLPNNSKKVDIFQFKLINPIVDRSEKRICIKATKLIKEDCDPEATISVLSKSGISKMRGEVFFKDISLEIANDVINTLKHIIPNTTKTNVRRNNNAYNLIMPLCTLVTAIDNKSKSFKEIAVSLIGYDKSFVEKYDKLALYNPTQEQYAIRIKDKFNPIVIVGDKKLVRVIKDFPSREFRVLIPR